MSGKIYALAPKAALIGVIERLVATLGRPICSADVKAHFRAHPEQRTDHVRPWGAVLAHLARPRPSPVPYLRSYGLIGNRQYYALERTFVLQDAWRREKRRQRVQEAVGWRLAEHIEALIGSPAEKDARGAAAGFIAEFSADREESQALAAELDRLTPWPTHPFSPRYPALIDRSIAIRMLRGGALAYHQDPGRAAILHINKMLAPWAWPQSDLFRWEAAGLTYSRSQISLLMAYHFDGDHEALSRLAVSRYVTE